jgi:hypothetical protein
MIDTGGLLGKIWIWLYFVIITVLLFNMILAIVFDVYGDVKAQTGDAQTLWEQTYQAIQEKRRQLKKMRDYADNMRKEMAVRGI